MDDEELGEVRASVGHVAMSLMEAVDEDVLEALGDAVIANERFVGMMCSRGVNRDQIAGILMGNIAKLIYEP